MVEAQSLKEISNSSSNNEMGELKGFRVGPDRGRSCKGTVYNFQLMSIDAHWRVIHLSQSGQQLRVGAASISVTKVESVAGEVAGRVPQVAGRRRGGRSEGPAFLPAR